MSTNNIRLCQQTAVYKSRQSAVTFNQSRILTDRRYLFCLSPKLEQRVGGHNYYCCKKVKKCLQLLTVTITELQNIICHTDLIYLPPDRGAHPALILAKQASI